MTLRYPKDLNGNATDYVIFQAHEYRTNQSYAGQQNAGGADGPSVGPPIIIYMPNSTPAMSNENSWGMKSFEGPLGKAIIGIQSVAAKGIMDFGNGDPQSTIDAAKKQFESMKSEGGQIGKHAVMNLMGGMTGTEPSAIMAIQRGQIYNPNIELLYQGPSMRTFRMEFNMIPKDAQEATIINQIILEFKKWSSPKPNGGMFDVPKVWSVKYMHGTGENPNMNEFKRAALLGITVQANASSNMHQTFNDGMPIVTSLGLSFQEVDIITRDDHVSSKSNQGF